MGVFIIGSTLTPIIAKVLFGGAVAFQVNKLIRGRK